MPAYTDEFKKQIVSLYNNKKPPKEIIAEYKISRAAPVQTPNIGVDVYSSRVSIKYSGVKDKGDGSICLKIN